MKYSECYQKGKELLSAFYDQRESAAIIKRLLLDKYGISFEKIISCKDEETDIGRSFFRDVKRICNGCPVQRITRFEEFLNLNIKVNEKTLIPREETAQLTQMVIEQYKDYIGNLNILDIGTGSGAIAISLAKYLPKSQVSAIDISRGALSMADKNCKAHGVTVELILCDILNGKDIVKKLKGKKWDIIISNPPYIPKSDEETLSDNVKKFDPSIALYPKGEDPLIFYKAISNYAYLNLNTSGRLFFEINEKFSSETRNSILEEGFTIVEIVKDGFGKDRFIWAQR